MKLPDTPKYNLDAKQLSRAAFDNNINCFFHMKALPAAKIVTNIRGMQGMISKEKSHLFNMFFEVPNEAIDLQAFSHQKQQLDKEGIPFCAEITDAVDVSVHTFLKSQQPTFISVSTRISHDINSYIRTLSKTPPQLVSKAVRNEKTINDWLFCFDCVWPKFGDTKLAFKKWFGSYGVTDDKEMQNFVYYEDNIPVGIATLHFFAGVVGPFSIAVVPDRQKSGVGQCILNDLAQVIKSLKYQYVVGQGSEEGLKLYKKAEIQILGLTTRYYFNS